MRVFLIRHAHAVEAAENALRPLSPKGRGQVRALATFLAPTGAFDPEEIWHSPLARSRESAELLASQLRLKAKLRLITGLEPEDDPWLAVKKIEAADGPFAIVGHEPQLSAVASLLVTGRAEPVAFAMKKCAALALERVEGDRSRERERVDGSKASTRSRSQLPHVAHWRVRWHVSPEVIA
ncbi:MAG: histidine phosphatase family protein [Opitutaceae bacterium]|nr:histidine phosphatase family protein [Opitutaceae bacterium]